GNGQNGIRVAGSRGNRVEGNFLGTDVSGTRALANAAAGVFLSGGSNQAVGGAVAEARNLISGNGAAGIQIDAGDGDLVRANYIRTDVTGARALGNGPAGFNGQGSGVVLTGGSNATVGGTVPRARNLIAGNLGNGVTGMFGSRYVIAGNYIVVKWCQFIFR